MFLFIKYFIKSLPVRTKPYITSFQIASWTRCALLANNMEVNNLEFHLDLT